MAFFLTAHVKILVFKLKYLIVFDILQGLIPILILGAQWLSGRVLDSRPRVRASAASLRCVLEQDTLILA